MDQNLENRIQALEKWKTERERQQIVYPLDVNSINVLSKYLMRITGEIETVGGAAGNTFIQYIGNQDNRKFIVDRNTYITYTVNVSTNYITAEGEYFDNDMLVYVATDDTPPAPLVAGTDYFVINTSGTTFQLSLTQGGAAINITDSGTGAQYIYFF